MTIVFLKFYPKNIQIKLFWSKISQQGVFGPKFRHFCFFVKFCKQTNLRVLISNMTIVLLAFLPKNTQLRHFQSQIQAFLFFTKFCNYTNLKMVNSNMRMFFSNSSPKIPELHIFRHFQIKIVSNLDIFAFLQNFQSDKIQGADFKYDNSFFKFQPKNTKIRHFWSQI